MKIAGLNMTDVWAHRVLRERGVETTQHDDVEAEINVLVESIDLGYHSAEQNYRPYLHVTGELRSIKPADAAPYGVREVVFPPDGGDTIDAYYEFTDAQLGELARKGYFTKEFSTPIEATGIEWELPAKVDLIALAPEGPDDIPVVFAKVRDAGSLVISEATSGYELTEYFSDFSQDAERTAEQAQEQTLRQRSDEINSLFSEEEFAATFENTEPAPEARQENVETVRDDFEARVQDVEAQLEEESERARAERAQTEGTPENLYYERVASALVGEPETGTEVGEEQEEPGSELDQEEQVEADGTLGFDEFESEDAELTVEPVKISRRNRNSIEETKAEVSRRVADLDHGDDDHGRGFGD